MCIAYAIISSQASLPFLSCCHRTTTTTTAYKNYSFEIFCDYFFFVIYPHELHKGSTKLYIIIKIFSCIEFLNYSVLSRTIDVSVGCPELGAISSTKPHMLWIPHLTRFNSLPKRAAGPTPHKVRFLWS